MINLSDLSSINRLATSMGNLILAIPNQNEGIRAQSDYEDDSELSKKVFLFDFEDEQTIVLESEITEHYTESSEMLTDNISLRPETITTSGFVAELNDIIDDNLEEVSQIVNDRLGAIPEFLPELSATAQSALNRAVVFNKSLKRIKQIAESKWQSVNASPSVFTGTESREEIEKKKSESKNQSRQAHAFQIFYSYYKSRTLFTVHTPWGIFKNCAIQTLKATQDGDTRYVSNFNVTFKVVRVAVTNFEVLPDNVPFNPKDSSPITKQQSSFEVDKGSVSLSPKIEFTTTSLG